KRERRGNGGNGFRALADALNGEVAVVHKAAKNALVDVDALDLVEAHLEGPPLDEPVLWTTRMLVTSVSVVQRWNQAVAVQYKAASPATAANAKQSNISASPVTKRHSLRNATATIHAAIAGRKNIQCSLVEYSTLSPGCKISSIYRAIRLP